MNKILGQLLIFGQFQNICDISGQLGALRLFLFSVFSCFSCPFFSLFSNFAGFPLSRSDLIKTFKIINGCYNLHSDLFFTYDEGQKNHSKKLYKKRSRLDLRKYVFSNRVIDYWNTLSDMCVNSSTINQFKNCLKRELQPETHT